MTKLAIVAKLQIFVNIFSFLRNISKKTTIARMTSDNVKTARISPSAVVMPKILTAVFEVFVQLVAL